MRIHFLLTLPALALAVCCNASTIQFEDLEDIISVRVDGNVITGNGGRISNFTQVGESVRFDITAPSLLQITSAAFTNLLDPPTSDDPVDSVSDRIVISFGAPFTTYHVEFGSDPDLPNIPANAVDLTTIFMQELPANPYYEDATLQKVATIFNSTGGVLDTYFVRSDITDVLEPRSALMVTMGMILILVACRMWKPTPMFKLR
jgi:hypothetical protein